MRDTLKYKHVADCLRDQIARGALLPGEKLYSELQLVELFGVSRQTVRQALRLLEQEGLLNRVRGSGTYILERPRRLIRQHTKTIGVIMTYVDDYIFPSILNGINACLSAAGYTINLYITYNKRINEERILRTVLSSPIDGLIIEPTKSGLVNLNQALYDQVTAKFPCVFVNCYYPTVKQHYVMPDNKRAVQLATDYLIERGHRKIAGVFKSDDLQGHLRFSGYAQALQEHELPVEDDYIAWFTTEAFACVFDGPVGRLILKAVRDCTAVVCYNDQVAVELVRLLRENGLSVPQDVSIISFDDALLARVDIPITTLAHPKERAGHLAAQNLLALIDDPSFDATHLFEPELIERSSVRTLTEVDREPPNF